jgi:hypothetical protein
MAANKIKFSPLWLLVAFLACSAAVGGLIFGASSKNEALQRNARLRRDNDELRHRNAALGTYSPEALRESRAQADLFRATLLASSQVENFKHDAQTFWRVVETGVETNPEYRKLKFELVRTQAPMSDWGRVVETVRTLQGTPGMTVRKVEIAASGNEKQRAFDRIVLGVTLFARTPKTE